MEIELNLILPIVIILGCLILIIIKKKNDEDFISDNTVLEPVSKSIDSKKDIIISKLDKNNNFPLNKYDEEIKNPIHKPKYKLIKDGFPYKKQLFAQKEKEIIMNKNISKLSDIKIFNPEEIGLILAEDVDFVQAEEINYCNRDEAVTNTMDKLTLENNKEYILTAKDLIKFKPPECSKDLLTNVNIKNLSKDTLDNSYLAELYNSMTAKVINNISKDQIDSITGIEVKETELKNMYKPLVSLIDKNLIYDVNNENNKIDYKFSGYDDTFIICSLNKN